MPRRSKPALILAISGSQHARKHPDPEVDGPIGDPPDWFTSEQAAEWRFAVENAPHNLLHAIDRATLTLYCVATDTHRQAAMMLNAGGLTVSDDEGTEDVSPYIYIIAKQAVTIAKAVSELGFSPSGRAGIGARQNVFARNGKRPNRDPAA